MGTKLQTIDEILIECGITHLTGKEHDAIIVALNQYSSQENKAILLDNTDLSIKNMQLKTKLKKLNEEVAISTTSLLQKIAEAKNEIYDLNEELKELQKQIYD